MTFGRRSPTPRVLTSKMEYPLTGNVMKNFRRWYFIAALLLVVSPVLAEDWYDYQHTTDDSLEWRRSNHQLLILRSDNGGVIRVTDLFPDTLWGLRKGDLILQIDGLQIKHVGELVTKLRSYKQTSAMLTVSRNGKTQMIEVKRDDFQSLGKN
jgi:hypothetical protein